MKNYYNVSFQYSESVFCSNLAHAETAEDVEKYYSSKYEWVKVSEASEWDVKAAQERGKPIIEVEHVEPEEEAEEEAKEVDEEAKALETLDTVETALKARKDRSAWNKGVTVYALELLESLRESIEGGYFFPDDLTAPRVLRKPC